jgi:hypothetical protein
MVRNLKLVGGSDDEDSDLEGEEVELQVGEDGKLIVPGTCTHTHLKCKQLHCLPFRDMIDSQSLWRRSLSHLACHVSVYDLPVAQALPLLPNRCSDAVFRRAASTYLA